MKRSFLVLELLLAGVTCTLVNSQTNTGGSISSNTTWVSANSPYVVTDNILVTNGVTLTIEPGVVVKFDSALSMQIDGSLLAQGTSASPITFTSNTVNAPGAWGYLYFTATSTPAEFQTNIYGNYLGGSILEYCTIQYAGGPKVSDNGAVRLNNARPFINHCTISDNSGSGIRVYNLTGGLKITNSIIRNNTSSDDGGGIYFYNDPSALEGISLMSGNTISNNSATSYGGGIWAQVCNYKILTISNNTITNNSANNGAGIYNGYHGTATISHNIVAHNTATNSSGNVDAGGGGIYVDDYTATTVSDNIIAGNVSASQGGGIFAFAQASVNVTRNVVGDNSAALSGGGVYDWYTLPVLSNNHIVRNTSKDEAGIYCSEGSTDIIRSNSVVFNTSTDRNVALTRCIYLTSYDMAVLTTNNIFSNSAACELYNDNAQGTPNIDATANWWGSTNDLNIQKGLYDWFDDNTLGIVTYSPYLAAPDTGAPVSPPANVRKTDTGGGHVRISWNRNPESDIAGYHIYYGGFTGYSFSNSINAGNDTSYLLTGILLTDTIGVTAYDRGYSPANELDSTIVPDNMTNGNESWYAYAEDATAATGVSAHDKEIPRTYTLQQNFPNPFNPSTSITFTLPCQTYVSLKVYDVLGKEVATLVSGIKAAGSYTNQWNATQMSSGTYFYRLQAGSFVQTKRLLLVR